MKLPYLACWDTTPVTVNITEDIGENGDPAVIANFTGLCHYRAKTKTIRTPDGQLIQLNGVITIGKDIAPEVSKLAGKVQIEGNTWKIYAGSKARNPDGSVNHTRLELE